MICRNASQSALIDIITMIGYGVRHEKIVEGRDIASRCHSLYGVVNAMSQQMRKDSGHFCCAISASAIEVITRGIFFSAENGVSE